jgi:hypothetical protein
MLGLVVAMLVSAVLFFACALTFDRFGARAERVLVRCGVTLIVVFVLCGVILMLNLIDYFL